MVHVLLVLLVSRLYAVVLDISIHIEHTLPKVSRRIITESTALVIQPNISLVTVRDPTPPYWALTQIIRFILVVFGVHLNDDIVAARRYSITTTIRSFSRLGRHIHASDHDVTLWVFVIIARGPRVVMMAACNRAPLRLVVVAAPAATTGA